MIKSVCIVGCGWFGLPLARALTAQGVTVNGSKREQSAADLLAAEGIHGFKLDLSAAPAVKSQLGTLSTALNTDCLVVNIPPKLKRDPGSYEKKLQQLFELVDEIDYQKIVFVSTTGVYPAADKVMTEQDAQAHSDASARLLAAETLFSQKKHCCITRFAGLVGPKRHPGRFLAGRTDLPSPHAPVNIVHLDDCVAAVIKIIFDPSAAGIYNVCAPKHPTRSAFYCQASIDLGLPAPVFTTAQGGGKAISSQRLMDELHFEYQFNDPLDMLDHC
ncbi:SDR family oxidoreductase [Shewanella sp.]|nr:SDR family oxidoreductase [Shewanella sp.]